MRKAEFTLEDFANQLNQMKKSGSMGQILEMLPIPGLKQALTDDALAQGEGQLKKFETIIGSMTVKERRPHPAAYAGEPCVAVAASPPATKTTTGANLARVFAPLDDRSGRIVAMGAIDNLVKGAAGQAVQACNLAAGLAETTGLDQLPLYP